jgi:hypothetical protein
MADEIEHIPGITDDPVLRLVFTGQAETVEQAEEMYLESMHSELMDLLSGPLTNAELERHPLIVMLRRRAPRGWDESIL